MSMFVIGAFCILLIFVERVKSYYVRTILALIMLVSAVIVSSYLTDIRVTKEFHGRLNNNVGRPYVELCEHLRQLSMANSPRLSEVIDKMNMESSNIYQSWLGPEGKDYFHFVQNLKRTP